MAARGVKTKVTDNDGGDFAYRQTIEDRYQLMAQLKSQLRLTQSASRSYFVVAICVSIAQVALHMQHSPLIKYHPLHFNMSPVPLLCLLILSAVIVYQAFNSIQHSASSFLLYLATLLDVFLICLTVILPLSRKAPLTPVDWLVLGVHSIGLSVVAFGLYTGFRFTRVSKTKRI